MAVVAPLEKTELPPVTDQAMATVEKLIDQAFWHLMLGDSLDVCGRDVDLLCAGLHYRFAQVLIAARKTVQ